MPRYTLFLAASLLAVPSLAHATVRLPALVGSRMVLQRGRPVPVWGWAAPGEKVSVQFRGKTYAASLPDASGRWQATLPAAPAGGPYTLIIKGQNTIELTDVLLGDVWLASGQSNMQMPVQDRPGGYQPVQNAAQEIAAANWPNIHFFTAQQTVAYRPQAEVAGTGWQVVSPATVAQLSAVAYFFGRDLYKKYRVPVGLLVSSWGGTPAEAWVSAEGLAAFPEFGPRVQEFASKTTNLNDDQRAYEARQRELLRNIRQYDKGYLPSGQTWAAPGFDARAWPTMPVPGIWESQPGLATYDGVIWFRKEIDLPASLAGQPLTLALGTIDDADSTYVNGVRVGATNGYNLARRYPVPAGLLRPGRNVIAVRVVDTGSGGGFASGEPTALSLSGGGQALPLAGPWQYQVGLAPEDQPKPPAPGGGEHAPTALYNGMIAPLQPYAIKGVIWYQGESNADRAEQYRTLFPALIADWRRHWAQPELPFLFVQLASFMAARPEPTESAWAELREAQALALRVPGTGLATAIDIGEANDIHPHNKQEVGRRLALAARHVAYGDNKLVYSGPQYASMTPAGAAVRLKFSQVGSGLAAKGAALQGFAVAGADHQFHWATAKIIGDQVEVQSPAVSQPVAVRYDWADNPSGNLTNQEGLPALPFRTDAWPLTTAGHK